MSKRAALLGVLAMTAMLPVKLHAQERVRLQVDSAFGPPGEFVGVSVVMVPSQGEMVAGVQNDITFDPAQVNLSSSACVINPRISDQAEGCDDDPSSGPCKQLYSGVVDVEEMRRFRGLIISLYNATTISRETAAIRLYTCTVQIAPDAMFGSQIPLRCSNQGSTDPAGNPLDTFCTDGQIRVVNNRSPTRFLPPTLTPTITPTLPPLTDNRPATPTNARAPSGSDDDEGCQLVAPSSSHAGWLLLVAGTVLLARCRRSSATS